MTTQQVFEHHLSSFSVGVDELMKDYTEASVIIAPEGSYTGLTQIRAFFQGFIDNFPAEAWESFQVLKTEFKGEVAYLLWDARPFVMMATDTFVIRDGKIAHQTYASFTG